MSSDTKLEKFIPLKNGLKQSQKFDELSSKLLIRLKTIPNVELSKLDNELIKFMCDNIEYLCKKKYNIDKQALLLHTLKRVVELSPEEENLVKTSIEFLINNKLIKKVSNIENITYIAKNFFLK